MVVRLLVLGVVAVAVDVIALIDLATIDRRRLRTLSKPAWSLIIVLVPIIGALLWFVLGRGGRGRIVTTKAPDDDPEFLRRLREEAEQQERIRRMEQELADLDERDADGGDAGSEPRPGA